MRKVIIKILEIVICREVEEARGEMEIEGKGKSLVTLERTETW